MPKPLWLLLGLHGSCDRTDGIAPIRSDMLMRSGAYTKSRRRTLWMLAACVGLLCLGALLSYLWADHPVAAWCQRSNTRPWFRNGWARAFCGLGKASAPIWLLLLWAWGWGRRRAAATAILALLLVAPVVGTLKPTVGRMRPRHALAMAEGKRVGERVSFHSMPSGDTAQVFAVATAAAAFLAPGVAWIPAGLRFRSAGAGAAGRVPSGARGTACSPACSYCCPSSTGSFRAVISLCPCEASGPSSPVR